MNAFTIDNTALYLCFKEREKPWINKMFEQDKKDKSETLARLNAYLDALDAGKIVPHKMIDPDQVQRMKRGLPYIMMTKKGAVKITPKNRRDAKGRFARKQ